MKRILLGCLTLYMAGSCFGQSLCPKHIETPIYSLLAQMARVQGKVTLKVSIGMDGRVKNVEVVDDSIHQAQQVLQKSAIDSMRHWTFEKPSSAPATQVIVYEYKFDGTLPVNDHQNPITKVNFDLPDRVTILTNELAIDSKKSKQNN